MATSGSVNFSLNRNELVTDSLIDAGLVGIGQDVEGELMQFAVRKLNMMLKAWQADGLKLWKLKEATLFMQKSQSEYSLGPSGDHVTLTPLYTEVKVAAVATDTAIDVDDTSEMTASDYIGIELDSGEMHWSTISSITDSDTVVIATAIPTGKSAAIDNEVYFYTTKINRPLSIMDLYTRDTSGNDTPVNLISREQYSIFGLKTSAGTGNQFYFDPQLTNAKLKAYPTPDEGVTRLYFTGFFPLEDMDNSTDDFDCPQEWLLAIQTNLTLLLTSAAASNGVEYKKLKDIAEMEKDRVLGWDKEMTSIYFQAG